MTRIREEDFFVGANVAFLHGRQFNIERVDDPGLFDDQVLEVWVAADDPDYHIFRTRNKALWT